MEPFVQGELFRYALVMLMFEGAMAETIGRRMIGSRRWIFLRTSVAELFTVVQPDVSDDVLAHFVEKARGLAQGGEDASYFRKRLWPFYVRQPI